MSLAFYYHPLASYCHKVLIALYENNTAFEPRLIDLSQDESSRKLLDLWPVGKMPVLHDDKRQQTIPETSIIIEYLDQHYPGARALLPKDAGECLDVRLWDRFFDLYIHNSMQRIVADKLRPENEKDPVGVKEARAVLKKAYGMLDKRMAKRQWVMGEAFTMADCSAAPALFYAGIIEPWAVDQIQIRAYFERLVERASFKRVIEEAQPYFQYFPFHEKIPARFLQKS